MLQQYKLQYHSIWYRRIQYSSNVVQETAVQFNVVQYPAHVVVAPTEPSDLLGEGHRLPGGQPGDLGQSLHVLLPPLHDAGGVGRQLVDAVVGGLAAATESF